MRHGSLFPLLSATLLIALLSSEAIALPADRCRFEEDESYFCRRHSDLQDREDDLGAIALVADSASLPASQLKKPEVEAQFEAGHSMPLAEIGEVPFESSVGYWAARKSNGDNPARGTSHAFYNFFLDMSADIRQIPMKVQSGTAVAMALSEPVRIPGSRINLGANIAVYRDAWAGALNLSWFLSDRVILHGGIGRALGSTGGTGAKAGMSIGW